MLFNSFAFAVFLPIVFLLYWKAFGKNLKLQNLFIVIVSYVFYGWWDWRFLFLIAFTTGCSYFCGLVIKRNLDRGKDNLARCYSIGNVVVNLAILGVFKYYNFFVDNLSDLLAAFSIHLDYPTLNIILPVGISFYTFQALSYTIDVKRRKIEPTRDVISFFAFVSFFPQLAMPREHKPTLIHYGLIGSMDEETAEYYRYIHRFAKEKGIKLVYLPPTFCESNYRTQKAKIQTLAKQMSALGIPYMAPPERFVYADSLYYDTSYHLTTYGAELRTKAVLEILREL